MTTLKNQALSRQSDEGGYAFLKRVLATSFNTREPVVLNTGCVYLEYTYHERDLNFLDGVRILEGGENQKTISRFNEVAREYDVRRGLQEIKAEQGDKPDSLPRLATLAK